VTTDDAGRVVEAEALSGPEALRTAVLANVRQWTLAPGPRTDTLVYRFEIDGAACNDDGRSLFRLVHPNLAVITACSRPDRAGIPFPTAVMSLVSDEGKPTYPEIARNARITGIVVLELSIDTSGAVVDARALNDSLLLMDTAVEHAKRWRVRTPAPRKAIVVYEFALDNHDCGSNEHSVFWMVTADYMRLSACGPLVNW
jgi:TonB family protein